MLQNALREDALTVVQEGYELRIGLPWIRSMPLSSVSGFSVRMDGVSVSDDLHVHLGERTVPAGALADEAGWWFIQDRLVLFIPAGPGDFGPGRHHVAVDFELMVPYLRGGGEGPLVLPLHMEAMLLVRSPGAAEVSSDVA